MTVPHLRNVFVPLAPVAQNLCLVSGVVFPGGKESARPTCPTKQQYQRRRPRSVHVRSPSLCSCDVSDDASMHHREIEDPAPTSVAPPVGEMYASSIREDERNYSNSVASRTGIEVTDSNSNFIDINAAADAIFLSLSREEKLPNPLPAKWHEVVAVLATYGFREKSLLKVIENGGVMQVLSLDPKSVKNVLLLLRDELGFMGGRLFRTVVDRPYLLSDVTRIRRFIALLRKVNLNDRDIKRVAATWPGLLSIDANRAVRVIDCLCTKWIGFTHKSIRSVIRRAPWILAYDTGGTVIPALNWLKNCLLVANPEIKIDELLRGCPQILGTDPAEMDENIYFLQSSLDLDDKTALAAVRHFPPILALSVKNVLAPVIAFMRTDLQLSKEDITRIVRAFPAILTLDLETELRRNTTYLRAQGISNVGRVVCRLPPVLSYDIDTNLAPKMEFLKRGLGLTAYDVLLFPGYFSYPLADRIEPRTRFLQKLGILVAEVGLNLALTLTDELFCERIANVSIEQYVAFKEDLGKSRQGLSVKPEDVCSTSGQKGLASDQSQSFDEYCPDNDPTMNSDGDPIDKPTTSQGTEKTSSFKPLNPPALRRRKKSYRIVEANSSWHANSRGRRKRNPGSRITEDDTN